MDQLPKEILLLIIQDLTFKEKFACALVCKKWLTFIRDSSLYRTLFYSQSVAKFRQAFHYFKDNYYGNHVVNLELHDCEIDLDQFFMLPDLFPNLKVLEYSGSKPFCMDDDTAVLLPVDPAERIRKWRNLQVISESNNQFYPIIQTLLCSPLHATNLTSVFLRNPQHNSLPEDWVRSICNAPALHSLNLDIISLSIEDLDYLLKITPQLITLVLASVTVKRDTEEEQEYSQPRNNVKNVTLIFSNDFDEDVEIDQWIDYLSVYTSIRELAILPEYQLPPLHDTIQIESSLIEAFPNWTQLKKYNMGFVPLTDPILQAMQDNHIEIRDMIINIDLGLAQLESLRSSSQVSSIQSLNISTDFTDFISEPNGTFSELLNQLVNLYSLDVTCTGNFGMISPDLITHLLYMAPNIKKLAIPTLSSQPSLNDQLPTNFVSQLAHLDIKYCQFDFSVMNSDAINQSLENALQYCPNLESFDTFVNIYASKSTTVSSGESTLRFRFSHQHALKKIKIYSLYDTNFKIVRNGRSHDYSQKHQGKLKEVSGVNQGGLYITIETDDMATIETNVMS